MSKELLKILVVCRNATTCILYGIDRTVRQEKGQIKKNNKIKGYVFQSAVSIGFVSRFCK